MDSYKLLNCDFQVGQPDQRHLISRIAQIKVSNFRVFSHHPIGVMTNSFPVHVTRVCTLHVKHFKPDMILSALFGIRGIYMIFM